MLSLPGETGCKEGERFPRASRRLDESVLRRMQGLQRRVHDSELRWKGLFAQREPDRVASDFNFFVLGSALRNEFVPKEGGHDRADVSSVLLVTRRAYSVLRRRLSLRQLLLPRGVA